MLGGLAFCRRSSGGSRSTFRARRLASHQRDGPPPGKPLPFERYADGPPYPLGRGAGGVRAAAAPPADTSPHPNPLPKGEGTGDAAGRIRVSVPGGMAIGQEFKANFRAVCTPPGWMADWKSTAGRVSASSPCSTPRASRGHGRRRPRRPRRSARKRSPQLTPLDAGREAEVRPGQRQHHAGLSLREPKLRGRRW